MPLLHAIARRNWGSLTVRQHRRGEADPRRCSSGTLDGNASGRRWRSRQSWRLRGSGGGCDLIGGRCRGGRYRGRRWRRRSRSRWGRHRRYRWCDGCSARGRRTGWGLVWPWGGSRIRKPTCRLRPRRMGPAEIGRGYGQQERAEPPMLLHGLFNFSSYGILVARKNRRVGGARCRRQLSQLQDRSQTWTRLSEESGLDAQRPNQGAASMASTP